MAEELSNLELLPWETTARGVRRSGMRVGRGEGSGKGKTAGRGTKAQKSRSGSGRRAGFEGGQMPLQRRLPKFGFTNIFAKDFEIINLGRLAGLEKGSTVTAQSLKEMGMISRIGKNGVKVLGRGDFDVALHVRVEKLSKSAAERIVAAGGTIEGPVPGAK